MARPVAKTIADFEEDKEVPKNEKKQREIKVEMSPSGLYECRMEGGGKIPSCLEGKFTSIAKINALLEGYYNSK